MTILKKLARKLRQIGGTVQFLIVQRRGKLRPPGQPEFDAQTLARFNQELAQASAFLEYGSGGSTLLADAAGVETISVESDAFYAKKVRATLSGNTTATVLVPKMGLTKQWGWPIFGARKKGRRYVDAPFIEADQWLPDLVLIDGRYRAACLLEIARKANQAGASLTVMFDDYLERPHYHRVEEFVGQPQMIGRTALFTVGQRPVEASIVAQYMSDAR